MSLVVGKKEKKKNITTLRVQSFGIYVQMISIQKSTKDFIVSVVKHSIQKKSWMNIFSSRRRHTRLTCDWSSDVCSSDLRRAGTRVAPRRTHSSRNRRSRTRNYSTCRRRCPYKSHRQHTETHAGRERDKNAGSARIHFNSRRPRRFRCRRHQRGAGRRGPLSCRVGYVRRRI